MELYCNKTLVRLQRGSVDQLDFSLKKVTAFPAREETDFLREEAEARYPTVLKICDKQFMVL
jgi:hypothetical protein